MKFNKKNIVTAAFLVISLCGTGLNTTSVNAASKPMISQNKVNIRWNNYVVYLPIKDAQGYYTKKAALISQHYSVSVGYLPLTERNILNTALKEHL